MDQLDRVGTVSIDVCGDWYAAVKEYLLHVQAHRAPKTVRFYEVQLRQLCYWTDDNHVAFASFSKRHLDRYLAVRSQSVSRTTLHHDGVAAKAFFKWCERNDLLERNPLADYEVKAAPRPPKYMPTHEDVATLLRTAQEFWNVRKNPRVKFHSAGRRTFHRDRNYAVLLLLIDTACRIGEALSLKVEDYRAQDRQITITQSKGREPRALPLSAETVTALEEWLSVRARVMGSAQGDQPDEGWLFLSEFGGPVEPGRFLKATKAYRAIAKLPDSITLHSLRRFSLNRMAKVNLLGAQAIAGHKNPQTTLLYTKIDPDFVRDFHSEVGVVKGLFNSKREARRRLL